MHGQSFGVFLRSPHAHARIKRDPARRRQGRARRDRHLHRCRPGRGEDRRPALRLADPQQGRRADEGAGPSGDRARQGPPRRRPGRAGDRRIGGRGQGRRRADRGRLRRAAGGDRHHHRADDRLRRARRGRRQRLLRLGPRRQGGGRRRVRDGGACQQARHRQQPADPERDGAAGGQRRLQQVGPELHALRLEPEPARRAPAHVRLRAEPAGIEGARDRARRRRRLRLEDLPLPGRRGPGLGEQARRPADQVDRRAQRIVPHRRARPRPRQHRRDGDGRARQLPGDARQDRRQHGRLSLDLRLVRADHPLRDAARRPVQDAGHLRGSEGGVHEHLAGRCLPRRRPAGGDLRGRAHRRAVRARHEDGPGGDPPAELHHHLPLRHAGGPDLRHRQLRRPPRQGDGDGRCGRLSRRAARPRKRRA